MITLRNFKEEDAEEYKTHKDMSIESIKEVFSKWNVKEFQNRYFEMFAIIDDNKIVGNISLYHHSDSTISLGPEVFECYRNQGFASEAMAMAMTIAKNKGYKIAVQQIRRDNVASIALHQRIGFETDGYVYKNKKGNEVLIYLKSLE